MTSTVVVRRSTSCRQEVQDHDFRITVSMDEYVKSKLRPIEVPKGYLSNTKEIIDGMLTNVKVGVGWHQLQDQTWRRLTRSFRLSMTDDRRN